MRNWANKQQYIYLESFRSNDWHWAYYFLVCVHPLHCIILARSSASLILFNIVRFALQCILHSRCRACQNAYFKLFVLTITSSIVSLFDLDIYFINIITDEFYFASITNIVGTCNGIPLPLCSSNCFIHVVYGNFLLYESCHHGLMLDISNT